MTQIRAITATFKFETITYGDIEICVNSKDRKQTYWKDGIRIFPTFENGSYFELSPDEKYNLFWEGLLE